MMCSYIPDISHYSAADIREVFINVGLYHKIFYLDTDMGTGFDSGFEDH
jgi:hypothetical protein